MREGQTAREGIAELHRQGRIVGRSLQEIANELHVTDERVRQVLATMDIQRPSCRSQGARTANQHRAEAARERWDALAQEHGFADFAALTKEWGITQHLQAREIAQRLGRDEPITGRWLHRHGYKPDRYRPTNENFRGVPKTPEHRAAMRAAWQRRREQHTGGA